MKTKSLESLRINNSHAVYILSLDLITFIFSLAFSERYLIIKNEGPNMLGFFHHEEALL
jgi:hypothetical protein